MRCVGRREEVDLARMKVTYGHKLHLKMTFP
jgi:hypothetical protein